MISNLLYIFIRLALLAVLTFLFVVLYEHGPAGYFQSVHHDFLSLMGSEMPEKPQS